MMSGQTSARRTKSASKEAGFEGFEGFEEFERVEGSEGSEYSERAWGSAGSGAACWRHEVRHSAMAAAKRICL